MRGGGGGSLGCWLCTSVACTNGFPLVLSAPPTHTHTGFLPLPVAQQKCSSCPSAGSEQPVPRPPIPLKMKKDGRQGHRAGSLGALAERELRLEVSEAMGGCGRAPRPGSVYRCGWYWLVSEHDSLRIDPRL